MVPVNNFFLNHTAENCGHLLSLYFIRPEDFASPGVRSVQVPLNMCDHSICKVLPSPNISCSDHLVAGYPPDQSQSLTLLLYYVLLLLLLECRFMRKITIRRV